jgi:hypothetical protein
VPAGVNSCLENVGVYQWHKTSTKEEDKISYCHKYLKSLYYLNKWVFKMNNYSFLSECFDFSFTSTEKILHVLSNLPNVGIQPCGSEIKLNYFFTRCQLGY